AYATGHADRAGRDRRGGAAGGAAQRAGGIVWSAMALPDEAELTAEIDSRRAELAHREREAADKERQLERYAADLRETFKQERARSQELRLSYMATVRALSNAVEARDAYTGKHAERVTAYGMEIARVVERSLVGKPEL